MAGPNGKSTIAPILLLREFGVKHYVNADTIAAGLGGFAPESVAFTAGRIMLQRLAELRAARTSFAFETTLATPGYAPWLAECRTLGFEICLLFLSLPSEEAALTRVARRVSTGGHGLYRPLADLWLFLENLGPLPVLWAEGGRAGTTIVHRPEFSQLESQYAAE